MGARTAQGYGIAVGLLIAAFITPAAHANWPALLRSDLSGLCIEASGAAAADGTGVVQSTCDGSAHQIIDFLPAASTVNVYRLRLQHANKCLQVSDTNAGTDLTLAGCANVTQQYFELFAQPDGSYQVVAQHSGLNVGLTTESAAEGVVIEQQIASGGKGQEWRLGNHDFSDPSVNGRWGDVIPWPHIAVSAANLPDGRILTFSGSERETWPSTEQTYSSTWDPATGEFIEQTHIGHNMFCAHLAMAADGQVFVNGGRNQTNSPWTSLFQYLDNSWTMIDNMSSGGRWYPTTLSLADGDMFTAIGTASNQRNPDRWESNPTPDAVARNDNQWRTLTGIDFQGPVLDYGSTHGEHRWWPLLHLAPQGKIFHSGPTPTMGWINTVGGGRYEDTGIRQDAWYHKHGSSIMYDEGKILNAGGWQAGNNTSSTGQSFTVDLTGPSPVVAPTQPMINARKFHNGVMSPLGDVWVVGGNSSGAKFSDNGRILSVETWDPDTGLWSEGAEMTVPRNYHSIALLLTDGRVLSAGSGYCSGNRYCSGASHRDGQVWEPPYLFNPDGSYASRPAIQSGPGFVDVGSVFNLTTDAPVAYFSMIKMGATTHGMNTDVRYLRPDVFDLGANTYQLTANPNPNVLSPGYWMIFAVDAAGVPSEAHVVRISTPDVEYQNVALSAVVTQSSTDGALAAGNAVDGDMTAIAPAIARTLTESQAWWEINLGTITNVEALRLWSRTDCCADELANAYVLISDDPFTSPDLEASRTQSGVTEHYIGSPVNGILDLTITRTAQYIRIQRASTGSLSLAEVQVFGDPPGAGAPGLVHYDYYEGSYSTLPDFKNLIPVHSGITDRFSIDPASASDGWALRFYGQLVIETAGMYNFYAASSDGSRIVIDGNVVVDNDGIHPLQETSGSISLTKGSHDIVVEYFDNTAAEALTISWEGPGVAKQEIPATALALLPDPSGSGEILSEWWLGQSGTTVSALTGDARYPDTPDGSEVRGTFEARVNWNDNYGVRMRGFIHPLFTGLYTFWISSDDNGELWLSSDEQPTNASLIANVPGWSASQQWDKFPEQKSVEIYLERGKRYYVEALMKEQGGGDNLAVAWQPPVGPRSLIAGGYLSQFTTPLILESVSSPPQVSTGEVVLSANAQGDALLYSWSFGDGTPDTAFDAAAATVSHTYAPGRYTGTVTIRDILGNEVQQNFQQIVHAPLTAQKPTASSSITYHMDRAEVWNVNPDNDSVSAIDANGNALITEIPVGANPRGIAVAPDWQLWVTNKDDGTISVIDPSSQSVTAIIDLGAGTQPHGVVADPSGTSMFVALSATGEVVKLDGLSRTETARAFVGDHLRNLAVSADGSRILATRFITPPVPGEQGDSPDVTGQGGVVEALDSSLVSISNSILQHSSRLASEHSGPGLPNYLGAPAISPDGASAWIPSKQDNILRGTIRSGLPLVHDQSVRAISSKIDLTTLAEDFSARIDHDNASVAAAAAFDPYGAWLYVALEGNRQIVIADAYQATEFFRFDAGRAPQGIALTPSGDKLFVHNFMDRSVTIHDLSDVNTNGALNVPLLAIVSTVGVEALTADVLTGKQFFYDARDDRLANEDYMSCASCHNEGLHDGRTWDFTQFGEGIRNTTTLEARGMGHGRVHWTGNFDEIQDFEAQIRTFALGTGLMADAEFMTGTRGDPLGDPKAGVSTDLDALAAYVNSLTEIPASPYRQADGALTPSALIGRDLFVSLDCGSCHIGSELTDSETLVLHDVGTLTSFSGSRLGSPLTGLDTPSLLALNGAAPFLHDGSAATLKAAILAHSSISMQDSDAESIATFLAQLDPADLVALPVAVPNVVGITLIDADTSIVGAGLVVGSIARQYSNLVALNDVISQDPVAETIVDPATAVNLVVSDGPLPPVAIPDLVGMTQAAATTAIVDVGLTVGIITTAYSDAFPAGAVISHNPAGGEAPVGTAVNLIISDGPEPTVAVPDLIGLNQAAAESAISAAGLTAGSFSTAYSDSVPAGNVISQSPASGVQVPVDTSVDAVVSVGASPIIVPNVSGLTQAQAESTLLTVGLSVGSVSSQFSTSVSAGVVISQTPAGGTSLLPGASVDLVVSDGPAPVSVPNLSGQTQATAEAAIVAAGLSVGTVINQFDPTVVAGNVISQDPAPGTDASAGSAVNLVISDGSEPIPAPSVINLSRADAENAIVVAGLTVGHVSFDHSDVVPIDSIISQNPAAGTSLLPGSSIDLTVSLGALFTGPNLSRGTVEGVSSNWQTVTLPVSYTNMVVIATPEYGKTDLPVVTRIRNTGGSTFELKVQNPSNAAVSGYRVRYIVLEAGVYNMAEHGINLEAVKVDITTTDEDSVWVGESQTYQNLYAAPVVLGQVMTANDPSWSVFWASDGNTGNPPSSSSLYVGKHVAEDSDVTRAGETIGYLVIESGAGQWDGIAYAAGVGADIVEGVIEANAPYVYPLGLFADTAVLSSSGMDGTNGGWPVLHAAQALPGTQLGIGIDEDQINDAERDRTNDQVAYLAIGEIVAAKSPMFLSGSVSDVGDSWQTVTLANTYNDMVVVATPEYSATDLPVVTRVRNAAGNQFELKVQNPSGSEVSGYKVRYVVVEAGVYSAAIDGIQMEATKYISTVTDDNNSWSGEARSYINSYSSPVVLGQVMTENDPGWSVFWASGANRSSPPSNTSLRVGKHVAEDPNELRTAETVGYIVIDAGSFIVDGVTVTAGLTGDTIKGPGDAGQPYTVGLSITADNLVLAAAAMDGVNGGWPVIDSQVVLPSANAAVLFDEDQLKDAERNHTTEQAAYLAIDE